MTIHIASDHGGFQLKNLLIEKLEDAGYNAIDAGPFSLDPTDDYPHTTKAAILKVQQNPTDNAILICRNGVGVTIFANRYESIRAGLSWTPEHAASHRQDDNTNILTLPADYINQDLALEITLKWLETEFSTEERHTRRLKQIEELS